MPEALVRLRVCAGCKKEVPRQDCHRNRYGEYICRSCQAGGLKFTWPHALTGLLQRGLKKYGTRLLYVLVALCVIGIFFAVLDRFSSAPAPTPILE